MAHPTRTTAAVAAVAVLLSSAACSTGYADTVPSRPVALDGRSASPADGSSPPRAGSAQTSAAGSTQPKTPAAAPVSCPGAPAPGAAHTVNPLSAGHLGTGAQDAANAVDIGAGCAIVVGGRFGGPLLTGAATLPGGGAGAVVRFDASGRRVLSVTRVAGVVEDLEVRRDTGDIAVATDKGVRVLDPAAGRIRWQADGAASRVAIGDRGTVASVSGSVVRVRDAAGRTTATIGLAGREVGDVAVDDRAGLVFVTGYRQYGGPCSQVQIPYVYAYDRTGKRRWTRYDYAPGELGDLCADSRGDRVAMGRDGRLYLAGETAGGNTVFSTDGRSPRITGPNVAYDKFTEAYNTKDAHLTYFARLDPTTGKVLAGQMLLARIDVKGDRGNTIKPRAITADSAGRVYVGGTSAYQIDGRASVTMNGRRLRPYAGGDAWVLVTSPDLKRRELWAAWTDGGTGEVRGLAVSGGVAALAARVDKAPWYSTKPSWQYGTPDAGGYSAVWPARS